MPKIDLPAELRVFRMTQIVAMVGKSRSSIYAMMNEKCPSFDPTFPRPLRLGKRTVGWAMNEIQAWIAAKVKQRDSEVEVTR
ncbi:MAG: AlpA family phage regulatory protein [Dechloromonas sp.]|nr:MAG: AlpA family phage regulatory protein [Dechloromonas sp.]